MENPIKAVGTGMHLLLPELALAAGILVVLLLAVTSTRIQRWTWPIALVVVLLDILLLFNQFHAGRSLIFSGLLHLYPSGVFLKLLAAGASLLLLLWLPASSLFRGEAHPRGEFLMLALGMLLGTQLLVVAHHLVAVYVALEILSICSYVLVAYARKSPLTSEAAVKYVIYGGVASGLMLYGMSLVFSLAGTLDMAPLLAGWQSSSGDTLPMTVAAGLVMAGALFKLAAAPLQFWAPDVYTAAPGLVVGLVATLPKIAAVGLLFHLTSIFSTSLAWEWTILVAVLVILSLTLGNLLALRQTNAYRLLAYSSIGQAGLLLLGPLLDSITGWSATYYYTGVYVLLNVGTVTVFEKMEHLSGSRELANWAGLGKENLGYTLALGICLIGLTGLPPTAGFTGKLNLFLPLWAAYSSTQQTVWLVVLVAAILFTVVSLAYYMRPLVVLLRSAPSPGNAKPAVHLQASVAALTTAFVLLFGLALFDRLLSWLGAGFPG